MSLRSLDEITTVLVADAATESAEFQIPSWASDIGVLIPADVGKGSINLETAEEAGGTFAPVLNMGILKKAKGDGGYFEIGPYIKGSSPQWVFKFTFGKAQDGPYNIKISFRGA